MRPYPISIQPIQNLGGVDTYAIRNSSTHARNQYHTPSILKPHHLPGNRLRRHEHSRHIDAHHVIAVLRTVLQRRRLLLDPRCGNQAVHAPVLVCDLLHDLVQLLYISDIDASVGERSAQLGLGALLDA